MMTLIVLTIVILSAGAFIYGFVGNDFEKQNNKHGETPIVAKRLLTEHEKVLFSRLIQLPNCHVFVQVSLAAFLHTNGWKTRNRFIRKIADFVITDSNLNILAVIELDDKSHDNKVEADIARDKMIQTAGYKTLRYRKMPTINQLYNDVFGISLENHQDLFIGK